MPLLYKKTFLFFLFSLFIFLAQHRKAACQTTDKKFSFDLLTINDGLSQGMVTTLLQDHYGFMWLGTKDGLNRYDGYDFLVYRHDPSDLTSLADNFISCIYEDSKGRLWIGTADHGLDLFIRETETFIHFTHSEQDKHSLSDNRVLRVQEDRNGAIWIGTLNGLNKLTFNDELPSDQGKSTQTSYSIKKFFSEECKFTITSTGRLWGSSLHHQLFTIQPQAGADVVDTLDTKRYCWYPAEDFGLEKHASLLLEDSIHKQLYLFFEYCITRVDEKTGEVNILSQQRFHWGTFGSYACLDTSGNIWLAESDWLEQFNVHTGKIKRVVSVDENLNPMLDNIAGAYHDRGGIIWIGTKGYGVLKFNPQSEKFHKTGSQSVGWMRATPDGKVIVCKYNSFLCVYDPITNSYPIDLHDSIFKARADFKDLGISNAVMQDEEGIFWFSKYCLTSYDARAGKLQRFRPSDRFIFPVYLDKSNGVWFGTQDAFSHYDKITGTFTEYRYPVKTSSVPYDFLEVIYMDASGIFWLGTISGLFRFDPRHPGWKQFKNIPTDSTSLSNDVIFSLCADPSRPENYFWIGTNGGGLNRFDKQTGKVIRFTQKDGLPNDVIYGILSDDEGNLWVSTNKGISRFNPQKKTFRNYELKDGLQGNEFNRYAYCSIVSGSDKPKTAWLFFGGVNGFNFFDPKELRDNRFVPNVQITDFKVRNKSILDYAENATLQKPVYLTQTIELPYSDNMITFVFAALDFTHPEKNLYQYKMEGFDKDWINSGSNHNATYTNLDPGGYTFIVKGSNSDGVWNEKTTAVRLIILPPWYMTWWFRATLVVAFLALAYTFYRYRLAQALQLQAVRNRIAVDLHDEVGSNLSNIFIFSNVAQQKTKPDEETAPLLRKIVEYTQQSMEAMSDIVWMINTRHDPFENIMARMRSFAAELADAMGCELHLDFDENLNDVKLNMEDRKHFYLIYKEALNNIAKYAKCKKVWIEMKLNHSFVMLIIRDNGKGFDMSKPTNGNGLINMRKRAELLRGTLTIESYAGSGTIIKLNFKA